MNLLKTHQSDPKIIYSMGTYQGDFKAKEKLNSDTKVDVFMH